MRLSGVHASTKAEQPDTGLFSSSGSSPAPSQAFMKSLSLSHGRFLEFQGHALSFQIHSQIGCGSALCAQSCCKTNQPVYID